MDDDSRFIPRVSKEMAGLTTKLELGWHSAIRALLYLSLLASVHLMIYLLSAFSSHDVTITAWNISCVNEHSLSLVASRAAVLLLYFLQRGGLRVDTHSYVTARVYYLKPLKHDIEKLI
jgi:hypothetical protein